MDIKLKRERSKNFSELEKKQFLKIIEPFDIIYNKRTDNSTVSEKHKAWNSIAILYNTVQTSGIRTIQQLQNLHKGLRKTPRTSNSKDEELKTNEKLAQLDTIIRTGNLARYPTDFTGLILPYNSRNEQHNSEGVLCDEISQHSDRNPVADAEDLNVKLEPTNYSTNNPEIQGTITNISDNSVVENEILPPPDEPFRKRKKIFRKRILGNKNVLMEKRRLCEIIKEKHILELNIKREEYEIKKIEKEIKLCELKMKQKELLELNIT